MSEENKHHPLFTRAEWSAHQPNKSLRGKMGKFAMNIEDHDRLHIEVPAPPTLALPLAYEVDKLWLPKQEDVWRKIGDFNISILRAIRRGTHSKIDRMRAQVTMGALELQRDIFA